MSLEDILIYIEKQLDTYLEQYCDKNMQEAIAYSLKAGGKRFRPMLCALTCEAFSSNYKKAIPFSVAIEYIHTYSLIHDDLPSMDNDDFRRGKLTSHKRFDEATAILAGDGLLNLAFEILIDNLRKNFSKDILEASYEVAKASGTRGMIRGQILDIKAENKNLNDKEILDIYENKTGKLIIASMKSGAILGGANEKELDIITKLAYNLGVAFQIKDDILDIIGDEEKIGKPLNSDIKNNKATYVSIYGLEEAKKQYNKLSREVLDGLKNLGVENKLIYQYLEKLINRES